MSDSTPAEDFSTSGWNILSQELIGKISRGKAETDDPEIAYSDDVVTFYSSGDKPKKIAYSEDDQEVLAKNFVRAFEEGGITGDHGFINWGAPKDTNHLSQWCIENAAEMMGTETINDSIADFEEHRDRWDEVNAFVSMPKAIKSLGKRIEAEYGDPAQEFPNAQVMLAGGDAMSESLGEELIEMYDLDELVGIYANTEFGAVAIEDEKGYFQTNEDIIIEILDEDAEMKEPPAPEKPGNTNKYDEDDIYQFDESLDKEVTGPILISAPHRDELPIVRGRLGDVWTAYPTDDGPRMEFEGREDNVINFSGAMMYPEQIDNAVRNEYDQDWKLVASEEDDNVVLNFFFPEQRMDEETLTENLRDQNQTMDAWYQSGSMDVKTRQYGSREELEEFVEENYDLPRDEEGTVELVSQGFKDTRIAFDTSYSAEKRGMN